VHDEGIEPKDSVALTIEGKTFATLSGEVQRLELTLRGAGAVAFTRVENDIVELEGELVLEAFDLRPRSSELRNGWLGVDAAKLREGRGSSGVLEVTLPEGLTPRTVRIEVPCPELTSLRPQERAPLDQKSRTIVMRGTPLFSSPSGGTVLAQILGEDQRDGAGAVTVEVLERREGMLRVRAIEPNEAVGWIASSATDSYMVGMSGHGYGVGGLRSSRRTRQVTCGTDLPIYVRTAARGEVRVGKLKAHKSIEALTDPDGTAPIEIALGQADLKPYVRPVDLARCPK
jgi:hypothetical protein